MSQNVPFDVNNVIAISGVGWGGGMGVGWGGPAVLFVTPGSP